MLNFIFENKILMTFNCISQDYENVTPTERPVPPTISVVISSPVIQIIEVGETVRLPCTAYHNIRRVSSFFMNNLILI